MISSDKSSSLNKFGFLVLVGVETENPIFYLTLPDFDGVEP